MIQKIPKWEKIANAGRDYALENFNNDKAANSLADLMAEYALVKTKIHL